MQQPNILFVFSDQHRWCDLGCYGNDEVILPDIKNGMGYPEAIRDVFGVCEKRNIYEMLLV
ncbi:MAG: hypothetical protein K9L89_02335 [Kiritimatiellales bacterium]|nr:hypothetical protein [Kiritimatiellales bacterium]